MLNKRSNGYDQGKKILMSAFIVISMCSMQRIWSMKEGLEKFGPELSNSYTALMQKRATFKDALDTKLKNLQRQLEEANREKTQKKEEELDLLSQAGSLSLEQEGWREELEKQVEVDARKVQELEGSIESLKESLRKTEEQVQLERDRSERNNKELLELKEFVALERQTEQEAAADEKKLLQKQLADQTAAVEGVLGLERKIQESFRQTLEQAKKAEILADTTNREALKVYENIRALYHGLAGEQKKGKEAIQALIEKINKGWKELAKKWDEALKKWQNSGELWSLVEQGIKLKQQAGWISADDQDLAQFIGQSRKSFELGIKSGVLSNMAEQEALPSGERLYKQAGSSFRTLDQSGYKSVHEKLFPSSEALAKKSAIIKSVIEKVEKK